MRWNFVFTWHDPASVCTDRTIFMWVLPLMKLNSQKNYCFLQRANDLAYRIGEGRPHNSTFRKIEVFIWSTTIYLQYQSCCETCCRLKKTSNISIKLKFCLHVALDRRTNVLLSMSFVSFTSYEIEPTNTGFSENTVKSLGSIP